MSMGTPLDPVDPQGTPIEASRTGYAVGDGQLRIDGDRFELDLSPSEAVVVKQAVEWDSETSKGLVESVNARRDDPVGFKGGTFRGDLPTLDQIVDALKRFEENEAGLGEDKTAYDARTAFNHSRGVVRSELGE